MGDKSFNECILLGFTLFVYGGKKCIPLTVPFSPETDSPSCHCTSTANSSSGQTSISSICFPGSCGPPSCAAASPDSPTRPDLWPKHAADSWLQLTCRDPAVSLNSTVQHVVCFLSTVSSLFTLLVKSYTTKRSIMNSWIKFSCRWLCIKFSIFNSIQFNNSTNIQFIYAHKDLKERVKGRVHNYSILS